MSRRWQIFVALVLPPVTLVLAGGCAKREAPAVLPAGASGLAERVIIRRDDFGVPHILADDEAAAAFALGYAQAEDHAAEIGRGYLAARGEAAYWFGREHLSNDLAMQRARNLPAAEAALDVLDPAYRRWLEAFVTGINTYVALHRQRLPEWMPEVRAADVLAHGRAPAVRAALRAPADLRERYPASGGLGGHEDPGTPTPIELADDTVGSNAFALTSRRTASGRPMLLANPHLGWSSRYWEAHVTVPGSIDFYGSTLIGLPVLRAGFGTHLAYAQTNNDPDLLDIYALPQDPREPDHYLYDGISHALEWRTVEVGVLTGGGAHVREVREYASTHLGPVVHRSASHVFVARSAAMESWHYHEGFYDLKKARNLDEFLRVMAQQKIPFSNFLYADADDNILYLWNARLPRRPETAAAYELDVPAEPALLWQGLHALDELPRVLNPPAGYVQNANNSPWYTTVTGSPRPRDYPPYVEHRELSLRAQRALIRLEGDDVFSVEDVLALKFDTRLLLADRVLPDLLAAGRELEPLPPLLNDALRVLEHWDRRAAAESRGAVVFDHFWRLYGAQREAPFRVPWDRQRPLETPAGLADPIGALAALAEAAERVRERHGELDVRWGDVHRFRFGELELPASGAAGTHGVLRVMSFETQTDDTRAAGFLEEDRPLAGRGDAWVLLVELGQPVTAWSVLAYGQSGDPASPHSRDQIELFANHQLRPVRFHEHDIRAHAVREYRPGPRGAQGAALIDKPAAVPLP